jgi:hypothetical protein
MLYCVDDNDGRLGAARVFGRITDFSIFLKGVLTSCMTFVLLYSDSRVIDVAIARMTIA